ncbi:unnamed protein product [Wuchereria bancrofti]|uniref:Nematode cuticle collagen N-terminal domain-containing protein n=1 Tax=Wuchereria bancrofti TaxID=6293 RepID=A0A3P7E5M3_WUCBA|nr:unnamed protein product [Wuchereria bancrofti]
MTIEDYFHYLAVGTTIFSSMTIVILLFAIPAIYLKAERERAYATTKSASFKEKSNKMWTEMKSVQEEVGVAVILRGRRSHPHIFSSNKQVVCSGCIQLGFADSVVRWEFVIRVGFNRAQQFLELKFRKL